MLENQVNKYRLLGIATFILFIIFSYLVHKDIFTQIDFDTTVRIQDHIPRSVDFLFSVLSLVGSVEFTLVILLVLFFLMSKLRYLFVLMSFGLFHFIEVFGKVFVQHPPPPFLFSRYALDLSFPSSYVRPGSSYPSGHAGRTAFLTVILLILVWNSKKLTKDQKLVLSFAFLAFSFVMFVSRVYLGEHWTSDVIGGILLGAALGFLSSSISSK